MLYFLILKNINIIEELCITEDIFLKIMDYYKNKYTPFTAINGYKISFLPNFNVEIA